MTGPSPARTVSLLAIAVLAAVLGACGVPDRGPVHQLDRVPFGLDVTTTSSTTTSSTTSTTLVAVTTTMPPPTTPPATTPTEAIHLYLVSGEQLRPATVQLPAGPTLGDVLQALTAGPPPGSTGLRSALDAGASITGRDDRNGVATVDLPAGFFEGLSTVDQRLAIGQIVLTLVERPGIGQVRFTRGGAPFAVPRGSGELSGAGAVVSRLDFLDLLAADVLQRPATPPQ